MSNDNSKHDIDHNKKCYRLIISIVTYQSEQIISRCLDSVINKLVHSTHPDRNFFEIEIWIYDNASTDKTTTIIQSHYSFLPLIQLKRSSHNSGFGAGHNYIMKNSKQDDASFAIYLILNPDTEILNDKLLSVLSHYLLNKKQTHFILTGKMLIPGSQNHTLEVYPSCHRRPDLLTLFLRRVPFFYFKEKLLKYSYNEDQHLMMYQQSFEFEWCSGAFMLLGPHNQVYFDERFFLYFEDTDLCLATKKLHPSAILSYHPEIEFIHHWEKLGHKKLRLKMIHLKSMIKYFIKWGLKIC